MSRLLRPVAMIIIVSLLSSPLSIPQRASPLHQGRLLAAPIFQSPLPSPTPITSTPPEERVPVVPGTATKLLQGRVTVEVPKGVPLAWLGLTVRWIQRLGAGQVGVALAFDLKGMDAKGKELTHFPAPLNVTLQVGEWVNWASRPDWLRPWVGYWDEKIQKWETITPTMVDEEAGVITFTTNHLSTFGAGSQGVTVSGWLLNFNDTRTDRFSGALVWEYPFDLPPGPGGIRPDLCLSYNSRRIDGILTWAQSDGVGWGWSIDVAEVVWRNVRRCWDGAHYYLCWDPVPLLVLNGEAIKLVPKVPDNVQYTGPGSTTYRFSTEDERFWRIEWKPGPENGSWEVTLKDGTRYLLGTTSDSRQRLYSPTLPSSGATVRWRVKEIIYPTGAKVTFTYEEETRAHQCNLCNISCHPNESNSERASYLTQIEYPGTRVQIIWDSRNNGNGPDDRCSLPDSWGDPMVHGLVPIFWQTRAVQRVVLERQRPNGTWNTIREWRFTYGTFIPEDETNKRLRILTALQEWALDGGAWKALPPITFGYQGYWNKGWCDSCTWDWDQARFIYPRLVRLDNGYGGVITVGYETPDDGYRQAWNYRVAWRQVTDGLGGGWKEVYSYSSDSRGRCYLRDEDQAACKWPVVGDFPDRGGGVPVTGGLFLGYREVTVAFQDLSGNTQRVEWTRFALPEGPTNDPWPVRGRPREHQVQSPDGQVLQTIASTYGISPTLGGAHFVFLQRQDTTTDGRTARTEWRYDAYGNITAIFEHGFLDVSGDCLLYTSPSPRD